MTATAYNGVVNTNEEWQNLATLTEITFEKDTIYSIQIQNPAWLKVGENGVPFLFNRDIPFPWKAKEDTDLYIKTTGQNVVLTIDTDTGFFLNKSGGGTTINNENITVTQNGEYIASEGYTGLGTVNVAVEFEPNNEDITVTANGTYTAGENYDGLGTVTVSVPQKGDLLKDEVIRTVTSKTQGRVPAKLTGVIQTGGTMTDDFVYTCASNAYLLADRAFPFDTADTWELYFKYKWAGKNSESPTGDDYKCPVLYISGNKLMIGLSSNGSSWDIALTSGNVTFVSETTYWFKIGFSGSEYYVDYNTDGSDTYTRMITISSTSKLYGSNDPMRFMNNNYSLSQRYCTGQLYLEDTKLYINGDLYWQAVTPAGEWQDL